MNIKTGFSPCPNDTFMLYALIHKAIDTEGIDFEPVMADVEALNQMANRGELPISKISYFSFAHLAHDYQMLSSGSALGFGVGPLLISKKPYTADEVKAKKDWKIAIPGHNTTANFLLSNFWPEAPKRTAVLFSDIEEIVLNGTVDMGVIIHENRFTYAQKGLHCVVDLGTYWEKQTKLPIPLGGIAVQRSLPEKLKQKLQRLIQNSVKYAFEHPQATRAYVQAHAAEMSEAVQQQHINLYVNDYSLHLGEKGTAAVQYLYQLACENFNIKPIASTDKLLVD